MPVRSGARRGSGLLAAAVLLIMPAGAAAQEPIPRDITGAVRVDLTWSSVVPPGDPTTPAGTNYKFSPALAAVDAAGDRTPVVCASQTSSLVNDANPGDVPCSSGPAGTTPVPNAHWAGTGYPPHLAFVDDDPAAGRSFCITATSYLAQVDGTATFTDPGGAQRPVPFSIAAASELHPFIGTTPPGDILWQDRCFRSTGGIGPPAVQHEPVPANQILTVSRSATVKVRLRSAAEFRVGAPATAKVTLYTAPPRSAMTKAVALGSAKVALAAAGDVRLVLRLSAKGVAAIRHRTHLRVSITASAAAADGTKGAGFAYAQLRNPRR